MRCTAQIGGLLAVLLPMPSAIMAFKAVFIIFLKDYYQMDLQIGTSLMKFTNNLNKWAEQMALSIL